MDWPDTVWIMKMMNTSKSLLIALMISCPAFASEDKVLDFNENPRSCVAHSESDWGCYGQISDGVAADKKPILFPKDWGRQFTACENFAQTRHRQSPVELPKSMPKSDKGSGPDVAFATYPAFSASVEHNCHTLQTSIANQTLSDDAYLKIAGKNYKLLQFHFHTPSEHVLDTGGRGSENYPLEIHFVHAAVTPAGQLDSSDLAVIGLFVEVDEVKAEKSKFDKALRQMIDGYKPRQSGVHIDELDVNSNGWMNELRGDYYYYRGSLTTPPCSEIVHWLVFKQPTLLSVATFRAMQEKRLDVGFANARPAFVPTAAHQVQLR